MILIIGGTGRLGREAVRLLKARGTHNVRVLARDPVKAMNLASTGIEAVAGDIRDAKVLGRAMRNVERLFVIPPNVHDQGEVEGLIYQTARGAGVSHVVKLSTVKADVTSTCCFFKEHAIAEGYLKGSDVAFTILRPNSFMQNLLWFAPQIKSRGMLSLPMGDAKTAPVDIRDVAAVAVAILSGKNHDGVTYNVTGLKELSFAEIAQELSTVIGKDVQYCNVSPEEFTNMLLLSGVPSYYAKAVTAAWRVAREGRPTITDVVSEVAKKHPISLKQFARDYANAFVC